LAAGKKADVGGRSFRIRALFGRVNDQTAFVIIAIGSVVMLFPLYSKGELKVGDRAPDFALQDQNGKTVRLSDFSGKKTIVLAFYMRASTPG
jgi:hypothetical protein